MAAEEEWGGQRRVQEDTYGISYQCKAAYSIPALLRKANKVKIKRADDLVTLVKVGAAARERE